MHTENGEPAALVFGGIAVPSDSFVPSHETPRRYRVYDKPATLNSIPLSQRTVELLTRAPLALLQERRRAGR